MAILIPSILTKSPDEVHEKLDFLAEIPEISAAQIDFADGRFVPNELATPKDIGVLGTRLELEAHLMVQKPQAYFHDLEYMGVEIVFIHFESFHSHHEVETALRNMKYMGFRCGLAVNPLTDIDVFDRFLDHLDELLVMGVNPGFQGQPFVPETLDRVSLLRKKYPDAIIEVDGGVKLDNIATVVAHGASKVNVGSGIWLTPDPKETVYKLLEKLKSK